MNPVVTAAAIGVGGTVIVGVAGFGASILNTRGTIAHARESRVWDRRADSNVETLAALHFRQLRREHETRTAPVAEGADQAARAYLANYAPPGFHELEARLAAFASQHVFAAVQASSTAHNRAIDAYRSWQARATIPPAPRSQPWLVRASRQNGQTMRSLS